MRRIAEDQHEWQDGLSSSTFLAGAILKSFRAKIILPTIAVLVVVVVVLSLYASMKFVEYNSTIMDNTIAVNRSVFDVYLEKTMLDSKGAAFSMALKPETAKVMETRDTKKILDYFEPFINEYSVDHYIITDSSGNVLAMTHAPNQLRPPRRNLAGLMVVKNALEGRLSSCSGTDYIAKISTMSGSPVYNARRELIGAIVAGISFDSVMMVDSLKELLHSDISIFLKETAVGTGQTLGKRVATTIKDEIGKRIIDSYLSNSIAKILFEEKAEYKGTIEIVNQKYNGFYTPLLDSNGNAFAAVFVGAPLTELVSAQNDLILKEIIIGSVVLVISIIVLFFIISTFINPVTKLSDNLKNIADGNMNVYIDFSSKDEIGLLAKSTQKVIDNFYALLKEINAMIYERSKGNTNYHFNSQAFNGSFRELADNILALADVGSKDHLTGLANRRIFDKRLETEWQYAIKNKNHISILLMDLDKFKVYNDSFGHQQGDVALQTAGNVFARAVNRNNDFVARWGGEEFVVLLPNTESPGASAVAENIRRAVEGTEIPLGASMDEKAKHLTVSIGIKTQMPTQADTIENFIADADKALYKAKQTGRNKFVLFESE